MNRKWHVLIAGIIFMILGWVIPEMRIAHLYIYVTVTLLPDFDILFKIRHRHWIFHSLYFPLLSLIITFSEGITSVQMGCLLAIGIHLLLDVSFKKKGGTYCVSGLNYEKTTIFLIVNGLISIGLFILWTFVN